MAKKIIMTEDQYHSLIMEEIGNTVELKYPVDCDKVLIIKNFLDKNFHKDMADTYTPEGIVVMQPVIYVMDSMGNNIEQIDNEDLTDRVMGMYNNMYLDKNRGERFIKKVVADWLEDKIGQYGTLSSNFV